MTSLVLSLLIAGTSFEHFPADGGFPDVTLIVTEAPTTSMLVTFGTGYGDDFGLRGLSAQTQTALTQANAALPLRKWNELTFAGSVELSMSLGRYQTHFILTAPSESFEQVARILVPALMSPRLDRTLFNALDGRASPAGRLASDSELIIQMLEPLILLEQKEVQRGRLSWHDFARIHQHVDEFISPGNAVITVVGGFDAAALRPLFYKVHRGSPRITQRPPTATDVHREVPSGASVHIFGYPLPPLSSAQVAGMRVLNRLLYERLTTVLREQGHAYSILVEPQVTPWFDGLLLVVPAFDAYGSDLEPVLVENISKVVHRPLDEGTVKRLVEAAQLEDRERLEQPQRLTQSLAAGHTRTSWLSPEYQDALSALTPESVLKASNELLVNERRRFYVRFVPFKELRPASPPPSKGTRR